MIEIEAAFGSVPRAVILISAFLNIVFYKIYSFVFSNISAVIRMNRMSQVLPDLIM